MMGLPSKTVRHSIHGMLNEDLLPFGVTKFEPEIDLSSDVAANVYVSIQSLDEVSVELCAIDALVLQRMPIRGMSLRRMANGQRMRL